MSDQAVKLAPSPSTAPGRTAAAKLHVLHLDPIKAKLGGKWERLSDPVHKLFEKAIREAQGPRDHFIKLDELSYVVTFNGLAFDEAALACAAIAQEVCEKLFGGAQDDISVRALVGEMSDDVLHSQFGDGSQISALLELNGHEIIVVSNPGGVPPTTTKIVPGSGDIDWEPCNTIKKADASLLPLGLKLGLFPVWDVAKGKSASMYVSAYARTGRPRLSCARQLLLGHADRVVETEVALLYAMHAYAQRIQNADKVCAMGAAVSYETLTDFNARIRYITALKSLTLPVGCPTLLKIEDVPPGTPLGKLAELINMLSIPGLRFTIQFKSYLAIPGRIDIRLGASGIGCALPAHCDAAQAATVIKKLTYAMAEQKLFLFVDDMETPEHVGAALAAGVRFGSGQGLNPLWFTGTEALPQFPLG